MSSKHKRLGSLAEIYQHEHLDGAITRLKLDRVRPSAEQPRQDATVNLEDLASSLQREGLLSPIVVTRDGEGYRIIAGERRFRAAQKLGWTDIECRIISREERDYWRIAIIENLQREDLRPEEEAQALLKLKKQENLSDADLAGLVGKSRNYVTEILSIASLENPVLEACIAAGIQSRNLMIQAAQAYRKGNLDPFLQAIRSGEIATVRQARDYLQGRARKAPGEEKNKAWNQAEKISMQRRKNQIVITCESEDQAEKLERTIHRQLPRLMS